MFIVACCNQQATVSYVVKIKAVKLFFKYRDFIIYFDGLSPFSVDKQTNRLL
jgi:hypothetical protein